ncbi:MAG TPA: hypothetical protein VGR89_15695 [Puia sp.]|nr:hypothetical protein [Puia sp.]
MARVNLPPGCMGFKAQDGTRYTAKPGTHVEVADHHMAALKNNDYAQAGLVNAGAEKYFVKSIPSGRWCRECNFTGYAWMETCSKCGMQTIPEQDKPEYHPSGQYVP